MDVATSKISCRVDTEDRLLIWQSGFLTPLILNLFLFKFNESLFALSAKQSLKEHVSTVDISISLN